MQVLILDDNVNRARAVRAELEDKGMLVLSATNVAEANAYLRRTIVDVAILRHWIGGRASLSVGLAAEYYNSDVISLLISDESSADADELFELLPSMSSLLGEATHPALIGRLAVAAITSRAKPVLLLGREERVWPDAAGALEVPVFISHRGAVTADRIPA